jgi:hypothetical protein
MFPRGLGVWASALRGYAVAAMQTTVVNACRSRLLGSVFTGCSPNKVLHKLMILPIDNIFLLQYKTQMKRLLGRGPWTKEPCGVAFAT